LYLALKQNVSAPKMWSIYAMVFLKESRRGFVPPTSYLSHNNGGWQPPSHPVSIYGTCHTIYKPLSHIILKRMRRGTTEQLKYFQYCIFYDKKVIVCLYIVTVWWNKILPTRFRCLDKFCTFADEMTKVIICLLNDVVLV